MRHGSGNRLLSLAAVFILVMTSSISALGQSQAMKTEDLIKRSDVIVVGKVGRKVSEWNEDKSRIRTRVTIAVDQTIKGVAAASTMTVIVPGGEVDGVGEWYSHTARFAEDEDVVVFAEQDGRGRYRVSGGDQGKISVKRDKTTGALMIPNFGPLDQFAKDMRRVVEAHEAETLQPK